MLTVNEYFQGNVKSIGLAVDGGKATIGVSVAPGEYEFGTSTVEIMKITAGTLSVKLPGASGLEGFRRRYRVPRRGEPEVPAESGGRHRLPLPLPVRPR